jgi:hypothetical protein
VAGGPLFIGDGTPNGTDFQFLQCSQKPREPGLKSRIVRGCRQEHANPPHRLALLRSRRKRPHSRAAEERDELATAHSITSSAVASSLSGTVRPSILAVSALMTSSNFDDCTTGKSAGFVPLRTRPT